MRETGLERGDRERKGEGQREGSVWGIKKAPQPAPTSASWAWAGSCTLWPPQKKKQVQGRIHRLLNCFHFSVSLFFCHCSSLFFLKAVLFLVVSWTWSCCASTPCNRGKQTRLILTKSLFCVSYSFFFLNSSLDLFFCSFQPFLFSKIEGKKETSLFFFKKHLSIYISFVFCFFLNSSEFTNLLYLFMSWRWLLNPRCGMHIAHAFLELDNFFSFSYFFLYLKKETNFFFFSVAALHCSLKTLCGWSAC